MDEASPQPPSPSHSLDEAAPASLERLVQHFVAAKRSLAATSLVSRANDIVTDARALVEETAVLTAKNKFVRRGVADEADVLAAVREGLDVLGREADSDFKAVVRRLDDANDRLQATLIQLSNTIVNTHSPNSRGTCSSNDSSPERKTLHDFIDEKTHLDLIESLRITIDSYNDAQASFQQSQDKFDDCIRALDTATNDADQSDLSPTDDTQDKLSPMPSLFNALTHHATETASLLNSLVSHYDLCATALKHTEGGGEAARNATPSFPEDDATIAPEDSLYKDTTLTSMTLAERQDMLQILETDAQEVDDVIIEIRERLSEMEHQLQDLNTYTCTIRTKHILLNRVLTHLRNLNTAIPQHIHSAKTFTAIWTTLKSSILEKTDDLVLLTSFYTSFISSYSSLLHEISRRAGVEKQMKRIAEKARREIEALYNEDVAMRREFLDEVGEFLPRDIWPGLVEAPKRWDIGVRDPEPEPEPEVLEALEGEGEPEGEREA